MTGEKIRTAPAARTWRAGKPEVVFTNGVFDLLHRGHLELLERARTLGHHLVVGVNDDASAARLGKGPGRPIVPADDRARLIAGFACVDCVVLFAEDTPERLIDVLEPDVLVKGGDWTPDTLPGAGLVRRRGGRVTILPHLPGRSTTALLERIRAAP